MAEGAGSYKLSGRSGGMSQCALASHSRRSEGRSRRQKEGDQHSRWQCLAQSTKRVCVLVQISMGQLVQISMGKLFKRPRVGIPRGP